MRRSSFRRPHSWPISRRSTRSWGGSTSRMTRPILLRTSRPSTPIPMWPPSRPPSASDAERRRRRECAELLGIGLGHEPDRQRSPHLRRGLQPGRGSTLSISSGDTLSLTGTASLSGTTSGAGTLALAGGSATIDSGAHISVSHWSISGAGADVTLDESLNYAGVVQRGRGRHVCSVGRPSPVERRGDLRRRNGRTARISSIPRGRRRSPGLTIGGTVEWENTNTVNESGGSATIGDAIAATRRSSTTPRRRPTTFSTTAGSGSALRRPRISTTPACSRRPGARGRA